ncbi:CG0192-related protein [Nigerium massiliense]|uniref:CG0192-related protein n=1 Tax=Nigerium massiliense TaxID=1522317 RepID=UPI00058D890D|nr:hypothetical protein [Nigerium massiliense]
MSGTADVHPEAVITPSKLDVVKAWLPNQSWFAGDTGDVTQVAHCRFVDPDGEVGIETLLLHSGGVTYQVPLTYRGEALDGADEYLLGTMDHSLLGKRWVYDATGDPVYVEELIRVIREGDNQAAMSSGEEDMSVRGSGAEPVANSSGTARLARVLDDEHALPTRVVGNLTGTWTEDGAERTAVLATLH